MVVATLLDRNPELSFAKPVDMDKVSTLHWTQLKGEPKP